MSAPSTVKEIECYQRSNQVIRNHPDIDFIVLNVQFPKRREVGRGMANVKYLSDSDLGTIFDDVITREKQRQQSK